MIYFQLVQNTLTVVQKLINDVMSGNNKAEAKLSDIINIEHELMLLTTKSLIN